jgi:hypothetical protein
VYSSTKDNLVILASAAGNRSDTYNVLQHAICGAAAVCRHPPHLGLNPSTSTDACKSAQKIPNETPVIAEVIDDVSVQPTLQMRHAERGVLALPPVAIPISVGMGGVTFHHRI